jgi:hypothetical protein
MAAVAVSNTEIVLINQYFANTEIDTITVKKGVALDGLLDYGFVDPTFRYNTVSQ